jgi:hypothetical protein
MDSSSSSPAPRPSEARQPFVILKLVLLDEPSVFRSSQAK